MSLPAKPKHNFVEAPTLYPSEEDFKDPIGFLSQPAIVSLAELYGILKLVPPKGWKPGFSINESNFKFHTRLQNLRELNLENRPKIFFFESLNNFLKMSNKGKTDIEETFDISNGQSVDTYILYQIIEYELNHNKDGLVDWKRVNLFFQLSPTDIQLKNFYEQYLRSYSKYLKKRQHLIHNLRQNDNDDSKVDACMICFHKDDPQHTLICDGCEESYHMKCLNPPLKKIPENDWYCDACLLGTFDYGFEEDFDSLFTIKEFKKYCQDFENDYFTSHFGSTTRPPLEILEREFWKLVDGTNVLEDDKDLEMRYGADIHNSKLDEISGFPTKTNPSIDLQDPKFGPYLNHPFNLTNLPFAEGSLLNYIKDSEISGMTVPWIYVGSLFSTFCWHKEDHYTLSSNYCHFGSTKKWYGIPAKFEPLFEKIVTDSAPEYFKRQPDLLHQLVTLLSPSQLFERTDEELTIVYADQNENEFIITYPKVYHAGFNSGFNFNELVNFTMPYWISDAERAIQDYKKVHKENVFNYYQLSRRILDEFVTLKKTEVDRLNKRYNNEYIKMINSCLKDLTKAFMSSNDLNSMILKYSIPSKKYIKLETSTDEPKKRGRKKENSNDDELLCDVCKTFLSFRWVQFSNIDSHNHDSHQHQQLLTPEQTPKMPDSSSSRSCEEEEFQRIISEAKKLSDITNIKKSGSNVSTGLGISMISSEDSDEPILKRRKSSRMGRVKPGPVVPNIVEDDSKQKKKFKKSTVKLCLEDFINLISHEEKRNELESWRRLFRNFENNDVHHLVDNCGVLYYDCDELETLKFIGDVGKKLSTVIE